MGNPDQPPFPDDKTTIIRITDLFGPDLVESGLLQKPPHKKTPNKLKRPDINGTASGEIGKRNPEK